MYYMRRKMNHKWTVVMTGLSATVLLISCSRDNGKVLPKTAVEPAVAYRAYLLDIRSRTDFSTQELASELCRWQALDDSVVLHLKRDTPLVLSDTRDACDLLHDSVRTEFCRLALAQPRTYSDILYLKECLSPYFDDEELLLSAEEIQPFFENISYQPACSGSRERTLRTYRSMLKRTLSRGIHGTDDLMLFIRQEDAVFRAFLTHLHELGQTDVSDITRDTGRCCMEIFQAAGREEISYKEAVIYLAMRTNRRLLLNVQQCAADIRAGRIRTEEQARAYVWMLLQPYASLDAFGIALLMPQERKELNRIAAETPGLLSRLNSAASLNFEQPDRIPALLIQAYIATL